MERELCVIPDDVDAVEAAKKAGLREFEDFIVEKYYKKKIVVIYGNCHTTVVSQVLSSCSYFTDEYMIYDILPICHIDSKEYFKLPIFSNCDVFIHQSIRRQNRYGEEFASENIIRLLKPGCKVIAIPNVYHLPLCFFPQYSPKKEFLNSKEETMFFRDRIIDEGYSQGLSINSIMNRYKDGEAFSDKELDEAFDKFMQKVRMREKDWDIKASEFISDNYRNVQLFFDPNHPTPYFLKYISKSILEALNVAFDEKEIDDARVLVLDSFEMPIHPSVKSHFHMTFVNDNEELRRSGRKVKQGKMELRQYISQYIAMEWQDKNLSKWLRGKSFFMYLYMKLYNKVLWRVKNTWKKVH